MEDKQKICDLLLLALQATKGGKNLSALEYTKVSNGSEYVIATVRDNKSGAEGHMSIHVTMDSGIKMMRDIIRELY